MVDTLNQLILCAVFAGYFLVDAEVCYATYSVNHNDKYKIDCEHGCCGYYYYRKCCPDPLIPVIVGSVIGGICFLGCVFFFICLCVYCSKKQNRSVNPVELDVHYRGQQNAVYHQQTIAVAYSTPVMVYNLPNEPPPEYEAAGSSNPSGINHSLPEKH